MKVAEGPLNPNVNDNIILVAALPLPTTNEVLQDSVNPTPSGWLMKATFTPGRGTLSMSEAEVAMGVDHFNWLQEVTEIPSNWEVVTLVNLDYTKATLEGVFPDGMGGFKYGDGTPIGWTPQHTPFFDPVVTSPCPMTHSHLIPGPFWCRDSWGEQVIPWENGGSDGPLPDSYRYYWNDGHLEAADWRHIASQTRSDSISFVDGPSQNTSANPFSGDAVHPYLSFETRLVGVAYSLSEYTAWTIGCRTNFTWNSNTVNRGAEGGVEFTGSWGFSRPGPGRLPIAGGGIFDVRFDDGTPIAGAPLDPPPIPTTIFGVVVNDGSAQRSMVTSLTVNMSASVTIDSGAFEVHTKDGVPIGVLVSTSQVDGRTVAVLKFTGADVMGGSLPDGRYTLTLHGDKMHDALGQAVDADADGVLGGDRVDAFFRLFGDADGDGDVDNFDLYQFKVVYSDPAAHPESMGVFDFNGDGKLDQTIDFAQLKKRYGKKSEPTSPPQTRSRLGSVENPIPHCGDCNMRPIRIALAIGLLGLVGAASPARAGLILTFDQPSTTVNPGAVFDIRVFLVETGGGTLLNTEGLDGAGVALSFNLFPMVSDPAQVVSSTANPGVDSVLGLVIDTPVTPATATTAGTAPLMWSVGIGPTITTTDSQILIGIFEFQAGLNPGQVTHFSVAPMSGDQFVTGQGNVIPETSITGATGTITVFGTAVPEPSTLTLLGIGTLGLLVYAGRRRHATP